MNNILKFLSFTLIIVFFIMFYTSGGGYYEYELNKKTILTNEAILKFEQDIKDGKEIDVSDYLITENNDYSNKFSNFGIKVSNNIGKVFSEGVKFIFDSLGHYVN